MVKNYKWELRKGGGKMICPNCGQRRFVPYVSSADHATLAGAEYGRCDREQSCGYHKYPNGKEAPNVERVEIPAADPIRFYPIAVSISPHSTLFDYVVSLFGVRHAMQIWHRYKIGAANNGETIFWQIAKDGTIRGGKIISYKADGHRDKEARFPATWAHKYPNFRLLFKGKELQQCYFGEHLLKDDTDKPVIIVESEKTAALMSELSDRFIWLASGGSQGLKNEEKNKVLAGREVCLLPDNGQYWAWKAIADAHGWHIIDTLEKAPIFEGCDILDYVTAGVFPELLKFQKQ